MGLYTGFRQDGLPALYGSFKTAVTADVLEAGFLFAMAIVAFSLILILPGVRGGKEKIYLAIQMFIGVFVMISIMLCNFGQEWEVAELTTKTQYRAGLREEIHAHIGVKISLRSVNITLKGDPDRVVKLEHGRYNETVDYNERFSWNNLGFNLQRAGFGPNAGRFNREFRAAQRKGTPYPILWVAEYFTIDGEGIRWGRHYLQAGFYTHILMWLAFPLWILSIILFNMVLRYGGYFTILTGLCLLLGNILWATIRNPNELVIPFDEGKLRFSWGWSFWLCMVNGLLCCFLGAVVIILDWLRPAVVASFFGVDSSKDFESFYVDPKELERLRKRKQSKSSIFSVRSRPTVPPEEEGTYVTTGNGAAGGGDDEDDDTYQVPPTARPVQRMYRKQTILGPRIVSKHPLKAPMPVPRGGGGHSGATDSRHHPHEHSNEAFDGNQI